MKTISLDAEECNAIPTATSIKNTAFTASILEENVSSRHGEEKNDKTHGFSKTVAELKNAKGVVLGYNAAIILRYLSAIMRKYGRKIEGKTWVRVNLDHISEQYAYMGRSTVDENVLRLQQFGCCELKNADGALKSRKNDRTRCYHIPSKWMNAAEEEPRYFSSAVASDVKVVAAVVYYNFCHHIKQCQESSVIEHVKLAPAILVELLPFDKKTIKRAIKTLVNSGYIHPVAGEQCWYAAGVDQSGGSKADEGGSKADKPGSKADEGGSKADNYIDCNSIVDELKRDSKGKTASSSFELPSFGTNQTNDLMRTSDERITTCAHEQDRKDMKHDKSFSPFADVVPLHEPTTVSNQSVDAHSYFTQDEVVSTTETKWPPVASLSQLHTFNNVIADEIDSFPNKHKFLDDLYTIAIKIGAITLANLDLNKLDDLNAEPDGDEVLKTLLPAFHQYLDEHPIEQGTMSFNIIYYGVLECMVGAFLWPKDNFDSYTHPITRLISATYKLHLKLWRRDEDLRLKAVDEEFAQWRHEHASADAHKEGDADLSPAEKMRVFRNALNTKNKVGWIFYDQSYRTDQITCIEAPALKLVQKLFKHNPELTPADLLHIMDGCMEAYRKQPAPKPLERYVEYYHVEEQRWHARMGYDLLFFITNLHHIVRQLGLTTGCPVKMFLQDIKAQEKVELELEMAA